MKGKIKISKNIIWAIVYQGIVAIMGFLLPRYMLQTYGVQLHGCVSTITSAMGYVQLLNFGLVTASIQVLYKPFSEQDHKRINLYYNSIRKAFDKISLRYILAIILVAMFLSFFMRGELDLKMVFVLTIVIGLQYVLECTLLSKYRAVLQASNRIYIAHIINTCCYFLRSILQIVLIIVGMPIVVVLFLPNVFVVVRWGCYKFYVHQNYGYISNQDIVDEKALSARKDAFIHQIAGVILNNTDLIVLTVFSTQVSTSIYAVYSLVTNAMVNIINSTLIIGNTAEFGMLVNGKSGNLEKRFSGFQKKFFLIVSVLLLTMGLQMYSFVQLYTAGSGNVAYSNHVYVFLFSISCLLNIARLPSLMLIDVAGHYKQTKISAVVEMVINLTLSLAFVRMFGIAGVVVGTIGAFVYRTIQMMIYVNKNIVRVQLEYPALALALVVANLSICMKIDRVATGWGEWIFSSLIGVIIYSIVSFGAFELVSVVGGKLKSRL